MRFHMELKKARAEELDIREESFAIFLRVIYDVNNDTVQNNQ